MKIYRNGEFVIGRIRIIESDIDGMARVGWVPKGTTKTVEVYVRTNDPGNTPHFHVRKYGKNNNFEWETCIKYEEADYFLHGKYTDKLPDKKIAKDLDKMLRLFDPDWINQTTYWQVAISEWNKNNSDRLLPLDLEQPDYTQLSV